MRYLQSFFPSRPVPGADLTLVNTGSHDCAPRHEWSGVRRAHLVHYVLEGRGSFEMRGRTHHLRAGNAFLITPEEKVRYAADASDPWTYVWIEFHGRRAGEILAASGLGAESPVFTRPLDREIVSLFKDMERTLVAKGPASTLVADAILFRILAVFAERCPAAGKEERMLGSSRYARRALDFLRDNHARDFSLGSLADLVGIHRAHLAEVFRRETGKTLRETLLELRIEHAKKLLVETDLSITEISNSVGYPGYTAFSIRFKALVGTSPGEFRRERTKESVSRVKSPSSR